MDFILGIFTGAFLMIALGAWLNEKGKKRKRQEDERLLKAIIEMNRLMPPPPYPVKVMTEKTILEEQLAAAIARDDFEEAARIRDLMDKH